MNVEEFWGKFCESGAMSAVADVSYAGEISFEAEGFVNDEILALVLSGKKTAIFASLSTYTANNEMIPVSGEYYVVLDRAKNPRCVIELESVKIVPFGEVTWEMARQEGMDADLDSWQERMKEQLEEEGDFMGFNFSPALKLVFQTFRVVYK